MIKSTIQSTAIRFKSLQKKIRKELIEEYEAKISKKIMERDKEPSLLLKKGFTGDIDHLNYSLDLLFNEGKAINYASKLV